MRARSNSLPLPTTKREPIELSPLQTPLMLNFKHTEKGSSDPITAQRMRSNSFDTTISAFHDVGNHIQQVGQLRMTVHQNHNPDLSDFDNIGKLVPNVKTAYVSRIDNFTFDGFNKGLPGVGKTLMNSAEHWAQTSGAEKLSLTPAPSTFTRNVQQQVPREGLLSKFSPMKTVTVPERKNYDPTSFYQHIGYGKDPVQRQIRANEARKLNKILPQDKQIDVQAYASRVPLLSKPLFQTVPRTPPLEQRQRSKSLPPPPKTSM